MKILYYKDGDKLLPGIATDKGVISLRNFPEERNYSDRPLTIEDIEKLKRSKEIFL